MIRRLLGYTTIFILGLLILIFYNYRQAQLRLNQERNTLFSIELSRFPQELAARQRAGFSWQVSAPESFSTTQTGIYWGYESTPSALMKADSPQAVRYPNFTPDYAAGLFSLPDTFDLNLAFDRPGVVYFRAYAKIDKDHLWTEEKQLIVK